MIPKKDKHARWLSDFWELYKVTKQKIYLPPKIQDILSRRSGYKYFTKIIISMQYYTFELTNCAKDLCNYITPFGEFQYNKAPMGVKESPGFAQEVMEDIFRDMKDVKLYINNIVIFAQSDNGFSVNPFKC
jgi:hypothetical protein